MSAGADEPAQRAAYIPNSIVEIEIAHALYRRSNSSHSELVSVQLLQSFCLPVILYGLEVTEPQKSALTMLNNLINRAVYKIFKVSDKDVNCYIRQCLGLHDI